MQRTFNELRKADIFTSYRQARAVAHWWPLAVHHTLDGQVSTITDANGNVTAYGYDAFERPIRVCYTSSAAACQAGPTAVSESFGYDHNGAITSHTTRAGQAFSFGYDALGRMTVKTAPSSMRSVYYAYDLQGNLTAAHFDSAGGADQVSAAYDALGRTTSATTVMGGVSRTLGYQYDALGDVTRLTHPDGVYFTMAYDHLQRVTEAWWTTSGGTTPFYGIAYDDLGRRTFTGRGSSQTNYTYDTVSRLASVQQQFAGNAGNVTKGFTRDAASGVVGQTRDNDDFHFGYGAINRSYTANGLNQYTAAGGAALSYDANGNLTSDGTNTFAYDAENKLVSASTAGGTTLTYDPLGRLYQTASGAFGTTQFLSDGQHVAAEYNGAGAMLRRFYWGQRADEPAVQDEGGQLNCSGTRFLGDRRRPGRVRRNGGAKSSSRHADRSHRSYPF